MEPVRLDHQEHVLSLLVSFFGDASNFRKLIGLFLPESQTLEDTFYDLWADCSLDTSEGAQLDQWGATVGQPRLDGWTDDDYRRAIKVRILVNLGEGEAWRVARVVSLLQAVPVQYRWLFVAYYGLSWFTDVETPAEWLAFLVSVIWQCTPAGVLWEASEAPTDDAFRLDIGPGLDIGKLGKMILP